LNKHHESNATRRRFLKLAGGAAVVVPFVGLSACGKQGAPAPASVPADMEPTLTPESMRSELAAEPVAPAPEPVAPPAAPAAQNTADWPRLEESDPVAAALAYKHLASEVDKAKYRQFVAGQNCANCLQWKGSDSDAWAPCGLFPGKLVDARGWCMSYVPKA